MSLQYFQEKIKAVKKQNSLKDFIKEIGVWTTFSFQKNSGLISKFPKTERIKWVVSAKDFQNIRDELTKNWKDYDKKKSFFEQFWELLKENEFFSLVDYGGNENADYSDATLNSRNIYMCAWIINNCENVFYSLSVKDNCTNVVSSIAVWTNSENVYQSTSILNSFKIFYSKFINNSNNIYFSSNLNGCSECIFCDNLDNVSYYIKNKAYTKEEYLKEKEKILEEKEKFLSWYKELPKMWKNINSTNVKGSANMNSENLENAYFTYNQKNWKNLILVWWVDGNESMYDTIFAWSPHANNHYGVMGANWDNIYNCMNIAWSSQIYYSYFLNDCSHCIGCIGLQNKHYCILNKEYSKEEWGGLRWKYLKKWKKKETYENFSLQV